MSAEFAASRGFDITPFPTDDQQVEFADGRKGSTDGLVDVNWSFSDTPEQITRVKCYVLPTCIHPIIFGGRFVFLENPWTGHAASLRLVPSITADTGVVGLEKTHGFWSFLNRKPSMTLSRSDL